MKIKQITQKMLVSAAKEFKKWYGVTVPIKVMVKFAETASYNDIAFFDTCSRENLASFVGRMVTGQTWPVYADGEEKGKQFFKKFKENACQFGIKVEWEKE